MLRKRWTLILLMTVLGIGSAYALSAVVPPQYEASSELYISVAVGEDATTAELATAGSIARQAVLSYAQFIETPYVLDGATDQLDNRLSASDLEHSTVAYARPSTSIIRITVAQPDAQLAFDALTAVVHEASRVITEEQYVTTSGKSGPMLVEVIYPPQMPSAPASSRLPLTIALGLFFGLAAGLIVAFTAHAVRRNQGIHSAPE